MTQPISIPFGLYTPKGVDYLGTWKIYPTEERFKEPISFDKNDMVSLNSMIKEYEDYIEFERNLEGPLTDERVNHLNRIKHRLKVLRKFKKTLDFVYQHPDGKYYINIEGSM